MIQEFVDRFIQGEGEIKSSIQSSPPQSYGEIVALVVKSIHGEDWVEDSPDAERIHEIDDGSYTGTLVFVIASGGSQPDIYWYVKVGYGSCSACDTLESIGCSGGDEPTKEQVTDFWNLALHVVQGLRKMED